MKTAIATLLLALLLGALGGVAVVYSGAINVAADSPHWAPVHALLDTARRRSIAVRAEQIVVPDDLDDAERLRAGAGNYQAMCVGCHLAPGMADTELSQGLSPSPPNLARQAGDPAAAFWVIKHGIQASAMPAWGKSMDDRYIWDLVAFIGQLPEMDEPSYRDWVARSDGHSHGGGEHMGEHADHPHHPHSAPGEHHGEPAPRIHRHADGKEHVHQH